MQTSMSAFLTFLILVFVFPVYAVEPDSLSVRQRPYVLQDQEICWLLDAHRELHERQGGIPGYRIQVYMDSGNQARIKTQRARAEFEQKYPDVKVYERYIEPYFRLRVGDFRTRLDARRFMEQIAEDYPPGSVYIVVDTINFPELESVQATEE
jgi:hypothetical protein